MRGSTRLYARAPPYSATKFFLPRRGLTDYGTSAFAGRQIEGVSHRYRFTRKPCPLSYNERFF